MKKIVIATVILLLIVGFFAGCSKGGGGTQPKTSQVNVSVVDDSGNALSGVSVKMGSYSGTTNNGGKYTFSNVNSGSYTIEASKDGYDSATTDMTVGEGETKAANLTLKTTVTAEEISNFSNLNSYKEVIETQSSDGTHQEIEILMAQKGKQQKITVTDLKTGEIQFALYIDGDKAKIKSDDTWVDIPFSQVSGMSAGFLNFAQSMVTGVQDLYNVAVRTPSGSASYSIERAGSETINGYPTIKYVMKRKTTSGAQQAIAEADVWTISSGTYKNYATRMIITINSNGKVDTMRVDVSDLNNVVISGS
jgi:hypothetical protein